MHGETLKKKLWDKFKSSIHIRT